MKRSLIRRLIGNLNSKSKESQDVNNELDTINFEKISKDLNENEKTIREHLGSSQDVVLSKFQISLPDGDALNAILVSIDGLVNEETKRNNIIQPLIEPPIQTDSKDDLKSIKARLSVKNANIERNLIEATRNILKARAFLMIDGFSEGILISIEGFEFRSIEEPESERTVRGSREGLIETTSVNLSLIRRRVAHPSLRFETLEIGEFSQTDITIAYVKDIAEPTLINRLRKRLHEIKVDNINSSGEVEQLIEDHPYSIFPTIGNTERSDKVAALLMEGRVFVFVNGDPGSLFVPSQFVENIKNIEDYSSRPYYVSFIRLLRFFAFFISIILPAFYISVVNFNKALIPSDLIVPLTVARESVPFPLALEITIMIVMFEVVREAGVRLPQQIGTAVSIVGPLILGEVAVSSSLVGAPTIIIVSISYIASFVITPIADVTALLRLILFIASGFFGSFGLIVVLLAVFTHMVSLTSLGVPYMSPFSPLHFRDWKDALIRLPTRLLKKRASSIPNQRSQKIKSVPNTEEKK